MSYGYDTAGNLHTFTDASGKVTTYGYDSSNRLATATDPTGVVQMTNTFDSSVYRDAKAAVRCYHDIRLRHRGQLHMDDDCSRLGDRLSGSGDLLLAGTQQQQAGGPNRRQPA